MASKTIPELEAATTIGSNDSMVVHQNGTTKKCSIGTFLSNLPTVPKNKSSVDSPESGAISLTTEYSIVTVPSGAVNPVGYTLAAGQHGDVKIIVSNVSSAQVANVVVTNGSGFVSLSFTATGCSVTLRNISGLWYIVSVYGAVNVYSN